MTDTGIILILLMVAPFAAFAALMAGAIVVDLLPYLVALWLFFTFCH